MPDEPTEEMGMEYLDNQLEMVEQVLRQRYEWATRQAADVRAKAEMLEDMDDPITVYGTDDPEELYRMAERLDRTAARLRAGEQFVLERYHD